MPKRFGRLFPSFLSKTIFDINKERQNGGRIRNVTIDAKDVKEPIICPTRLYTSKSICCGQVIILMKWLKKHTEKKMIAPTKEMTL
jgi:hypothetical protein